MAHSPILHSVSLSLKNQLCIYIYIHVCIYIQFKRMWYDDSMHIYSMKEWLSNDLSTNEHKHGHDDVRPVSDWMYCPAHLRDAIIRYEYNPHWNVYIKVDNTFSIYIFTVYIYIYCIYKFTLYIYINTHCVYIHIYIYAVYIYIYTHCIYIYICIQYIYWIYIYMYIHAVYTFIVT